MVEAELRVRPCERLALCGHSLGGALAMTLLGAGLLPCASGDAGAEDAPAEVRVRVRVRVMVTEVLPSPTTLACVDECPGASPPPSPSQAPHRPSPLSGARLHVRIPRRLPRRAPRRCDAAGEGAQLRLSPALRPVA